MYQLKDIQEVKRYYIEREMFYQLAIIVLVTLIGVLAFN